MSSEGRTLKAVHYVGVRIHEKPLIDGIKMDFDTAASVIKEPDECEEF